MDSELTPVRTSLSYTISVQGPEGWVPVQHYGEDGLDAALEDLDVMTQINQEDAFRLYEQIKETNHVGFHVVAEHFPDGEVYGPVNEPISWLDNGF